MAPVPIWPLFGPQYAVGARDGKLWLSHLKHGETGLEPASADVFSSGFWFMPEVRFARDASGSIDRVILGGGRITGITFRKVVSPETP